MDIDGRVDFLGNCLDVSCRLPATISDDIRLERPMAGHLKWFRTYLSKGTLSNSELRSSFESELIEVDREKSIYTSQPLSRGDWKYLTVTSKGRGIEVHEFFMIANLLRPTLWSVAHRMTTEPFGRGKAAGWGFDPLESVAKLFLPEFKATAERFDDEKVINLREALQEFRALDSSRFQDIRRAVRLLHDLKMVPRFSQLLVLGKFSVLEMLLTHNPELQGNDDSISHQIRTKIALVDRRLPTPLDYSSFRGSKPNQVWSALYAYRSAVAHGGSIDFRGKNLKHAQSKKIADEFISTAVRAILRHALKEPGLFESLKPI